MSFEPLPDELLKQQTTLSYEEVANMVAKSADSNVWPCNPDESIYPLDKESRTTYINILDFSSDETFVPTVYIKNDKERELMADAYSRIGSTVSMEKTNIEYEKPKVELRCMNHKKYDPNDALLLYAIGSKIPCANRDIYLSDVGELVNAVNLLTSVTNNKLAQLKSITNRSPSILLQTVEFQPTKFNVPQIFVEPLAIIENTPNNNDIKPYNDNSRLTPFKFNEQTNIPLSFDPVNTKTAPYYVKPAVDNLKPVAVFKPAKNSIRTADLHSSWFVTDNDLNPSTKGVDLNLQRFKFGELVDNKTTYYVYVNTHEYSTFVQNNNKYESVFKKYPEYGFQLLVEYKTNNNDVESFLKTMFDKKTFTDKDDLENQLLNASKYIIWCNEMASQNKDTNEYEIVKQYINHLFMVEPGSDSKQKATDIFQLFEDKQEYLELKVDTNFRNRLSKYLLNMGLNKKRLSDGYYYYGLKRRE